jgi:hypothetical protein
VPFPFMRQFAFSSSIRLHSLHFNYNFPANRVLKEIFLLAFAPGNLGHFASNKMRRQSNQKCRNPQFKNPDLINMAAFFDF